MSQLLAAVLEELEWRGVLPSASRPSIEQAVRAGTEVLQSLVDVGVPPEEALLVVSQASGIAVAPKRLIETPEPPLDCENFVPLGGVPIGKRGALPCVAFSDPLAVARLQKMGLQPHVPLLVLPAVLATLRSQHLEDEFDSVTTAAVDTSGRVHASVDVTDPDAAANAQSQDRFVDDPSADGVLPVEDDVDDDAATVVNDIASLAALAAQNPTVRVDHTLPPVARAAQATMALVDEEQPRIVKIGRDRGAVAHVASAPPTQALSEDGVGIDPALLAAVVIDEIHDEAQARNDIDPATMLTAPLTPEEEARYGAMKTTAMKLHVDDAIAFDPSVAGDDDLFSVEDGNDSSLLDEIDSAEVHEASGFEADDPLAAQATIALPNNVSRLATIQAAMPSSNHVSDDDDGAGPTTVVSPIRQGDDSTRPTPAGTVSPVAAGAARAVRGPGAGGRTESKSVVPMLTEPDSPPRGQSRGSAPLSAPASNTAPRARSDSSSSGSAPAPPASPRYQVQRVLGRGGMATVYLASDKVTGEEVALKILEAHLAADETFIERFRREMRATENLKHPNIVRCFDAGEVGGDYFIAAEYVDAGTLSQLLKNMGTLPVPVVVGIMEQALLGLQYAHETGTVHRDLKPANMMFNKQGVLKIGDFGIAKSSTDNTITQTGTLFGTPAYMSPEQAMGKELDARSDLFSIGIVFYQLLTGENPFHFDNPSTSLFRISSGMYPPIFDRLPSVPQLLDDVIVKLLARDREERYRDATAALQDLEPLVKAIRSRHPDVERRVLADHVGVGRMLREDEASLYVAHGRVLLDSEQPRVNEGMFHMFQASRVDPENYEATNALAQYRIDHQIRFDHPDDPRIDELEQAMGIKSGESKCTPAQLRRAVDLHQPHRDLYGMARYLRRYLRMMPQDSHMQMRWRELCGGDPLLPFSPVPFMAKRAVSSGSSVDDEIAVVVPAGQIRRKADPRAGASARAGGKPVIVEERTPMAAASASGDTPTPSVGSNSLVPAPPEEPPKDSLEALQRAARQFWIETVRSATGDRGVEGLREWWADRFGRESREELKKEAKELLAASKVVLTEKQKALIEEAKKESTRQQAAKLWEQHKRLILTVGGILVVYSLLSFGCAVIFSNDDKPKRRPDPRGMPVEQ